MGHHLIRGRDRNLTGRFLTDSKALSILAGGGDQGLGLIQSTKFVAELTFGHRNLPVMKRRPSMGFAYPLRPTYADAAMRPRLEVARCMFK
jgi:hypothetical protein